MTTKLRAATSSSGTILDPSVGDGVLELWTGNNPASQVLAASFAADGTPTFLKTPSITTPNTVSMVRVNTANGYGSTNTKIARFTNVITNQGTDIIYADSATLGGSFTVNTNGVYAISHTPQLNVAGWAGISLSTATPATAITSISANEMLVMGYSTTAAGITPVAWTGYLTSGSVIRSHTDGAALSTGTANQFTITRVA
jgi:hypothetical protein